MDHQKEHLGPSGFKGAVGALQRAAVAHPVASGLAYAAFGALLIGGLREFDAGSTPLGARLAAAATCAALCVVADRMRPAPSGVSSGNAAIIGFCAGPWLPWAAVAYAGGQVFYAMSKLAQAASGKMAAAPKPQKAPGM